nr:YitT family protein [Streptococcus equi]
MEELGRGVTYLHGEGAYSGREKQVIYVALGRSDVRELKAFIAQLIPMLLFLSLMLTKSIVRNLSPQKVNTIKRKKIKAGISHS